MDIKQFFKKMNATKIKIVATNKKNQEENIFNDVEAVFIPTKKRTHILAQGGTLEGYDGKLLIYQDLPDSQNYTLSAYINKRIYNMVLDYDKFNIANNNIINNMIHYCFLIKFIDNEGKKNK